MPTQTLARRHGWIILVSVILFNSGCAKISHLRELLTLKAYSENKDAQGEYVRERDAQFERLLAVVRRGEIGQYPDQKSFVKAFGPPLLRRPADLAGQPYEQWLYRYAVRYFDSDKVYLYFASDGRLYRWDYIPYQGIPPGRSSGNIEGGQHGTKFQEAPAE